MFQEIYVIDNDDELTNEIEKLFNEEDKIRFKRINIEDLKEVFVNLPQLIIINDDNLDFDTIKLCNMIRKNDDNDMIPIIVVSSNEDRDFKMNLAKDFVEYYIAKSMGPEYLYYRIRNIFRLLVVNRTFSPLTGLPGNVQIQTELKKRLKRNEEFTVLYLDLDNFKAYNDVYGFLKGDEIIKFTANTIIENVNKKSTSEQFLGHIGGDDIVAILNKNVNYEHVCQSIVREFDKNVKQFFTEDDAKRGFLKIQNRKGKMERFPLTSISIGVVLALKGNFTNVLEIGEVGAQLKHVAKKYKGSCYAIDRSKYYKTL